MRIVIGGLIGTFPLGGVAWDFGQYIGGFRRLGHEVFYLEDTGRWLYDAINQSYTDDAGHNVTWLARALERFDVGDRWALRGPSGRWWGRSEREAIDWCSSADLLLNISGALWLRPEYQKARCKIYLDGDPGYTHAKIRRILGGNFTPDEKDFLAEMRAYDRHLTFAENIGQPDCLLPMDLCRWQPTRQPIIIDQWLAGQNQQALSGLWSTVMSWKIDEKPPEIEGKRLGAKDVEFENFMELPRRVGVPLEVSLSGDAPRQRLSESGWQLRDGHETSRDADSYHDYILKSRGEWSVAKQAYVATRSGWFSGRTACYLAAGKPAVVQDTGWSKYYRTGRGLFHFSTIDEAAAAIEAVEANYDAHSRAAREIACEYFDSAKVLSGILG